MKATQIAEILSKRLVSKSKGIFTVKNSYYWGMFSDGETKLADFIKSKLPNAQIIDKGNHYHDFVGGAKSGSAQDSYFWVKFTLPENSDII